MNTTQLLSEIKFEEDFENCMAQDIINASNLETYDWKSRFYRGFEKMNNSNSSEIDIFNGVTSLQELNSEEKLKWTTNRN